VERRARERERRNDGNGAGAEAGGAGPRRDDLLRRRADRAADGPPAALIATAIGLLAARALDPRAIVPTAALALLLG